MKSKVLSFVGMMTAALFICSCGGANELRFDEMCCKNNTFSVAKGDYELKEKVMDGDTLLMLKVKFVLTKSTKAEVDDYPEIALRDKDGMTIFSSWDQLELTDADEDKFDDFIAGKLGREAEFVFINEFEDEEERVQAVSKSSKFAILEFALEELEEEEDDFADAVNSVYRAAKAIDDMDDYDAEEALKVANKAMKTSGEMLEALDDMDDYDAEEALKVANKAMKTAGEMLEALDDMDDMW